MSNRILESINDISLVEITAFSGSSYTAPVGGLYCIEATAQHHGDSCPGGTGRYGFRISTPEKGTLDSYSGNHTALRTLKATINLKAGETVSAAVEDWCSNCSYHSYTNTANWKISKYKFGIA